MPTMQRNLFTDDEPRPGPATGCYADVVFDRPLDYAYTYAVPENLQPAMAVGKRVQVPFGRGDRTTVGYCVRVSETPPDREVKELRRVLDDEALLTPNLVRLTRWMADYYLCGWGQVLNAVVPAGAKEQAGTRSIILLEAIPQEALPQPLPALTAKQTAVLALLRAAGKPVESKQLARQARCGQGPLEALVTKGFARREVRRVDKFTDTTDENLAPEPSVTLNVDQLSAW